MIEYQSMERLDIYHTWLLHRSLKTLNLSVDIRVRVIILLEALIYNTHECGCYKSRYDEKYDTQLYTIFLTEWVQTG